MIVLPFEIFTEKNMFKMLIFLFTLIYLISNDLPVTAAATHMHTHSHHDTKERLKDGVYSPRDAQHHDEAGQHHSEFDHEAILGSVKEAEEFDNLSPEESKSRLSLLVKKMDTNQDQYVDRHELKAWILRSLKMLSEEEANERFDDIDENQDEKISWDEYMIDVYGMEDEENELEKDHPYMKDRQFTETKMMSDDKEMFHMADRNNDGFLNHDEFVMFQVPEESQQMLPLILKQTLRDKDEDKDGYINFKEFIGESAKNHDKEWLIVEKEKFDNDFDKDKDGILNGNEILSWVVPSNDEIAQDEVDHLFVASDEDHDDRLSYAEIIDKYDIFVGSEATDYGDHLQKIHHFADEL